MRPEPVVAVVVAAGSGVRLGGDVPKALRMLGGRPLVAHAVANLLAGGVDRLVVVGAPAVLPALTAALAEQPADRWSLTVGGDERQDSVRLGLEALDVSRAPGRIVLVHDAARPLAPPSVVARVIAAVRDGAVAVVPVVPVIDTIRLLGDDDSRPVDRSALRAVQTPQGFDRGVLSAAHRAVARSKVAVTDDAAVCEHLGHPVTLVAGSRASLKITEPEDLIIAEALLTARPVEAR